MQRLQKSIYLYLCADCFMKISLHSWSARQRGIHILEKKSLKTGVTVIQCPPRLQWRDVFHHTLLVRKCCHITLLGFSFISSLVFYICAGWSTDNGRQT